DAVSFARDRHRRQRSDRAGDCRIGRTQPARNTAGARTPVCRSIEDGVFMSHVFYRKLHRTLPTIVKGEGVWLFDVDGKRYLDASGGAMVANIGHGVEEIASAMRAQAASIAYVNGTQFTSEPVEELASM